MGSSFLGSEKPASTDVGSYADLKDRFTNDLSDYSDFSDDISDTPDPHSESECESDTVPELLSSSETDESFWSMDRGLAKLRINVDSPRRATVAAPLSRIVGAPLTARRRS